MAIREAECMNTSKKRLDMHYRGQPLILAYNAPYGPGMQLHADQKEVIYDIASQA